MKALSIESLLVLGVILPTAANAAGLHHNTNQSAEWVRTLNRNASTDIDAVFYNPAATALFEDGLHLYLSNQMILQNRYVSDSTDLESMGLSAGLHDEYQGELFAPLFPSFYAAYKTGSLAVSAGFGVIGGGGSVTYEEGLPSFHLLAARPVGVPGAIANALDPSQPSTAIDLSEVDMKFEGDSVFHSAQLGGAYAVNDWISLGLVGRLVFASESTKGTLRADYDLVGVGRSGLNKIASIETKRSGMGFGLMGSAHLRPIKDLDVSVGYQWYDTMELENETEIDDTGMFPDGTKVKKTLPMVGTVGVAYAILPELRAAASLTYGFDRQTDWDGAEKGFRHAWEPGISFEYTVLENLEVSIGYLFAKDGRRFIGQSDLDNSLNAHTLGGGGTYSLLNKTVDVTLGFAYTLYPEKLNHKDADLATQTYNRNSMLFALGIGYKAF